MIIYTTAKTVQDLEGILALQQANLTPNLSSEEIASQGFVTVVHSLADLQNMNKIEPHVIAKKDDVVIAYLLAMTPASQNDIPVLRPMFNLFNTIELNNKIVSSYRYIVVGQVCVDKAFRAQGILDQCYQFYRQVFKDKYDFAITEIATRNIRSVTLDSDFRHAGQVAARSQVERDARCFRRGRLCSTQRVVVGRRREQG